MYSIFQGILLLCLYITPVASSGTDDCGSFSPETLGYITSPGFPAHIPKQNVNCKWKISLRPSDVLTVSFTVFEFPTNSPCAYLRISPSSGDKDMANYNGRNPPQDAYISTTSGATMVITLVTCNADPTPRFNLTYMQGPEHPSHPCPSNQFTCASGKCILNSWVCNGYNECGDDSDEQNHCATTTPYPHDGSCPLHHFACISSSTGQMQCFQELRKCDGHADCENGDDEESCSSICTYLVEGNEGSISSPNYPQNYYENLDCSWRITVDEGGVAQLRFLDFSLEAGYKTDFVKVFDGNKYNMDGEMELIGQYYGDQQHDIHSPPSVIESSGNSIVVAFHTDNSLVAKGFNASFQLKGHCIDHQKPCGEDDNNCFDLLRERCDGRYACYRGQDEMGCRNCSMDMIPCKQPNDGCFDPDDRCNGDMRCRSDGEDEKSCPAEICGEHVGLFLCGDGTCIEESWMCDVQIDCTDGSDEENCALSPKLVTAAVIGSLVCGMLLVAALSCTCKLYQLHHTRREGYSSHSPYYIFGGEFSQREAPPSYSATMASPHYAELQRAFVEGVQGRRGSSHSGGRNARRRSRLLNILSQNSPGSPDSSQSSENRSTSDGALQSGGAVEEPSRVNGIIPEGGATNSQQNEDSQNGIETSSFSTSDTDSETNQEAQLSHQILNAAANIHRIRIANRVFHLQNRARREEENSSEDSPQHQGATATPSQVENSECSSQGVTLEEEEDAKEHEPAVIVGVREIDDRDDVQLLDDI